MSKKPSTSSKPTSHSKGDFIVWTKKNGDELYGVFDRYDRHGRAVVSLSLPPSGIMITRIVPAHTVQRVTTEKIEQMTRLVEREFQKAMRSLARQRKQRSTYPRLVK